MNEQPNYQFTMEDVTINAHKAIYHVAEVPNEDVWIDFNLLSHVIKLVLHVFDAGLDKSVTTGATYVRFLGKSDTTSTLEFNLIVTEPVPEGNGIAYKEVPDETDKYVRFHHKGSRSHMLPAYEIMQEWMANQGVTQSEKPMLRMYANTKHDFPESELISELLIPIN